MKPNEYQENALRTESLYSRDPEAEKKAMDTQRLDRKVLRAVHDTQFGNTKRSAVGYATVKGLADRLGLSTSVVRLCLIRLEGAGDVWRSGGGGNLPREWRLTAHGMGDAGR